jgi:hypothetical protein
VFINRVKPEVLEEQPVPSPLYQRSHVDLSRIIAKASVVEASNKLPEP